MKKFIRLVLINFLILVAFVAAIEAFFYVGLHAGLLHPRAVKISGSPPTERSQEDVIAQYGRSVFETNPRYVSDRMYDWSLSGLPANAEWTPGYYDDYANNLTQSKTYHVVRQVSDGGLQKNIFSLNYTYDESGLLKTPSAHGDNRPKKFVAAVGCSFTFGMGVPTEFNYPSQLAEKISSDYRVFNFGFHGFGFNDLYARTLKFAEVYNPSAIEEGVVLWLFLPEHLDRFFCRMKCLKRGSEWQLQKPRVVEKDGQLMVDGQIGDHTFRNEWLRLLARSNFLAYLNIEIPSEYSPDELRTMAHTYAEIAFHKIKPAAKKRVYLINLFWFAQKEQFFAELKNDNIQVLDYSDIPFRKFVPHLRIPVDGHPTPEFYSLIAQLVHHDVFVKKDSL